MHARPRNLKAAAVPACIHQIQRSKAYRDFPGGPLVKTSHFHARAWVRSLVRELRSHMPHGAAKQKDWLIFNVSVLFCFLIFPQLFYFCIVLNLSAV